MVARTALMREILVRVLTVSSSAELSCYSLFERGCERLHIVESGQNSASLQTYGVVKCCLW